MNNHTKTTQPMRIRNYLLIVAATSLFASCSTSEFMMVSEGESFDALSKITDNEYPSFDCHGGNMGQNLVYTVREKDGSYNIYMKDNVLSRATIQKTYGTGINVSPAICDANGKIAFQFYDKNNFDIYYVDAKKGKAITQVTYTDENEYNPAWSDDGTMIIFEKGAPPRSFIQAKDKNNKSLQYSLVQVTKNQLWLKNLQTGELKMLGEGSFPSISPDGKWIAFIKYDLNKQKTAEVGTLWIMTIDGDSPRQLTTPDLGYATRPNWSPDGTKLVFQLTKKNKQDFDIYTIDINGENLRQHTTNPANDFSPYWSKDNFIYFSSDRGAKKGMFQIWRFKIEE
jgi:TolB protein